MQDERFEQVELVPGTIPEWEAEDAVKGVFGGEDSEASVDELLNKTRIELPRAIVHYDLRKKSEKIGDLEVPETSREMDFYYVRVPVNIVLGPDVKMTRLALEVGLSPGACAFEMFPKDATEVKEIVSGQISIDISKALAFVLAATAPVAAPLAGCLGIEVQKPFAWQSTTVRIETSDEMSNPALWRVYDKSILSAFVGQMIVQTPEGEPVRLTTRLACSLKKKGLFGKTMTTPAEKPRRYSIGG